jgi:tetratricopeptide (TPR) repeat protein
MKKVSRLALAAVLTLGVVATPAAAQKKKDGEQEAPKLQISEAFRKPAAAAETALKAQDWATAETQLAAAEAVAANEDEKYYAAFMRMSIELHKQALPGIIKAADALIASPKTPPAHLAEYYYKRGQASFLSGKRPEAIPFLLKARELGFAEPTATYMIPQAYFDAGNVPQGLDELAKAIDAVKAKGGKPDESLYNFAVSRVYKTGDRATTAVWLMRETRDFPTIANWRRVIVLYRESVDKAGTPLDRMQKIDLLRLMRATGGMAGQGDYYDYSASALAAGLPWEAVAVIDEGRKAGVIPQAEPDFAKVYAAAKASIANEGSLDKLATSATTAKEMVGTGDAFLSSGNYARALEMYDKATAKGGVDADQIALHRGMALFQLGRKDEARTAFGAVRAAPLADIAKFWVTWMELPPLT